MRIAVVGAGLSGLTAAHRLLELASQSRINCRVTVFEASPRRGGVIGTERIGDYLVDLGADSFITNKPAGVALCQRIGLGERLIPTIARYRGALVLSNGRPQPVPEGFQLISPTAIQPLLATPILGPWTKARMLAEWLIPPRQSDADESLADFVRRRFGRAALDRLIQPLVGGIYTADPERLSMRATLPQFLQQEAEHGSLLRGALIDQAFGKVSDATSRGARYGLFAALAGGSQELLDRLVERITAAGGQFREGRVTALRCGEHGNVVLTVNRVGCPSESRPASDLNCDASVSEESASPAETYDGVILAMPSYAAAELVEAVAPQLAAALNQIEYASSAIVVSGHRLADVAHPLNAFGLVIPHRERRRILAVSFASRKLPGRAPADRVLLRTFVGGAMQPEELEATDRQVEAMVRDELRATLGVGGVPDFMRVVRWNRAMPQYTVGHLERVAGIFQQTDSLPRVALTGNAYRGVGIPDVIAHAEAAADGLISRLAGK